MTKLLVTIHRRKLELTELEKEYMGTNTLIYFTFVSTFVVEA